MTANAGGYGRFYTPEGTEATPPPNDGPASNSASLRAKINAGGTETGTSQPDAVKNETLAEPDAARRESEGLNAGGENSQQFSTVQHWNNPTVNVTYSGSAGVSTEDDWRVRISLPPGSSSFYRAQDPALLTPLLASGIDGVIFPYTPEINIVHNARYQEQALTHSNYKSYFYEGSDVAAITISGDFTAQNQREADYVLAAMMFFRACTRMNFGNDPDAGTPPVIVFLDGYGHYVLPHVACVITQFQQTMPADVDYIPSYRAKQAGRPQRIPTMSKMSVTLQPVMSRQKVHNEFNLGNYAKGWLTDSTVFNYNTGTKYRKGGFL